MECVTLPVAMEIKTPLQVEHVCNASTFCLQLLDSPAETFRAKDVLVRSTLDTSESSTIPFFSDV